MLTQPQDRRSFLRSAGLIVATVAAAPYVRKFWPGWGNGLVRRRMTSPMELINWIQPQLNRSLQALVEHQSIMLYGEPHRFVRDFAVLHPDYEPVDLSRLPRLTEPLVTLVCHA